MALKLEVLNARKNVASDEDVLVRVSLIDDVTGPVTGAAANLSMDVFDAVGSSVATALPFTEVTAGIYLSSFPTLDDGVYVALVSEATTPIAVAAEFEKGPDLAASELLLDSNIQREFVIATSPVPERNVVTGGVEGFWLRVKRSSDPDFSTPLIESFIEYWYRSPSPASDIIKAQPGTPSSVPVTPADFPFEVNFSTLDWDNLLNREIDGHDAGERIVTAADSDYEPMAVSAGNYLQFDTYEVGQTVAVRYVPETSDVQNTLHMKFDDLEGVDVVAREIALDTKYRVNLMIDATGESFTATLYRDEALGTTTIQSVLVNVPSIKWVGIRLTVVDNPSVSDEVQIVVDYSLNGGLTWLNAINVTETAAAFYGLSGQNGWEIVSNTAVPKPFAFDKWSIREA